MMRLSHRFLDKGKYMSYFSVKTKDPETVNSILSRQQSIEFRGINVLQDALVLNSPLFVVLGGDRPSWEPGLIGIGVVSRTPFDIGYEGRNFKIQVDMKLLLEHPIKREDLVPFADTYGTIGIAPITKWEPNQALSQVSDKHAIALMRAMIEIYPNFADELKAFIGEETYTIVTGPTTKFYPVPVTYGADEEQVLRSFITSNQSTHTAEIIDDDESINKRKAAFRMWLTQQVKPDNDSDPGEPYTEGTINGYVQSIASLKIDVSGQMKPLFSCVDVGRISQLYEQELKSNTTGHNLKSSAIKKYQQFCESTRKESQSEPYKTGFASSLPRNRIFFGAPGTGKSFLLNKQREELLGKNNETDYERVTFHPDYSYAHFVGVYKPVSYENQGEPDSIKYEFVPGPFMRVYVAAMKSRRTGNAKPFLLIIEEINRANVAAVFSDVFQLLDRGKDEISEYPIQASEDIKNYLATALELPPDMCTKIRIPDNMFIWATMNSADQGVFPMDTAFKRRWDFTYISINACESEIIGKSVQLGSGSNSRVIEWNILRREINNRLSKLKINEDKLLGPYFLSPKTVPSDREIDTSTFVSAFKNKVLMYLFEDAAKQKRALLFAEGIDISKFSSVCDAFDEKGVFVFCTEISSQFIDAPINKSTDMAE